MRIQRLAYPISVAIPDSAVAAILDLDGTIVDLEQVHRDSFRLAAIELCAIPAESLRLSDLVDCFGRAETESADCIIKKLHLRKLAPSAELKQKTSELLHLKQDYVDRAIRHMEPNDIWVRNAEPLLRHLLQRFGASNLGIYSGSQRDMWRILSKKITILNKIQHTVFSDDSELKGRRGKPEPDGFIELLRQMNQSGSDTIVFEDTPQGAAAALRANCNTVFVSPSYYRIVEMPALIRSLGRGASGLVYLLSNWEQISDLSI